MTIKYASSGLLLGFKYNIGIASNMFEVCLKYAWNILKVCLKCAWNILEVCLNYALSMLQVCFKSDSRKLQAGLAMTAEQEVH